MHRTTILLPEDLRRDSEREASRLGISLGELIRRRLRQGAPANTSAAERVRSRFFRREPWVGAGPNDVAVNHDAYLYDT